MNIRLAVFGVAFAVIAISVILGLAGAPVFGALFAIIVGLPLLYVIIGIRTVQEQERWVIERFGRFHTILLPGLCWIAPGIMQVRAILTVQEQMVPLFVESIEIDFKDGSAKPVGVHVFVKLLDQGERGERSGAYKAIYAIVNWRTAIIELLENVSRSYFNTLEIDEVIQGGKGGYDLLQSSGISDTAVTGLRNTVVGWGFEVLRLTVTDFDLPEELVRARGEVQMRAKEADAALFVAQTRAQETIGTLVQMFAELSGETPEAIRQKIHDNDDLRARLNDFAEELVTRRMSVDGNALTDIRVAGGGDLERGLLNLIAALKTTAG